MKKLIALALLSLLTVACKKNQLGGNATISGTVRHHAKPISDAVVYIKFNAKEFPGHDVAAYDDKVTVDAAGNYSIRCYKGDYYLYSVGRDPAIVAPYLVTGGAPVRIRAKEEVRIDLAVTEGD